MKHTMVHPVYGQITYEENIISGKKSIFVNGKPLQKLDKKTFIWDDGPEKTLVKVKSAIPVYAALNLPDEQIWVVPNPLWYEWILSLLIPILVIAWGNSPALCSIFPIVGGALGGLIGGIGFILCMCLLRGKKIGGKLLVALLSLLATFGAAALTLIALIPVLIL